MTKEEKQQFRRYIEAGMLSTIKGIDGEYVIFKGNMIKIVKKTFSDGYFYSTRGYSTYYFEI